jgi:DNA (cytosine-5)-methyltransferase 1
MDHAHEGGGMRYGSVCSGIEAVTMAWEPVGFKPSWFAEIDPHCNAVLSHRYPDTTNHGDFTKIGQEHGTIDILVGGTPCQDFSVAGLRAGLDGENGDLALQFVELLGRLRPSWVVWENVPGVLSLDDGGAFGAFLGALEQCGYGWAYRTLDAQYAGVPQRRRRIFVVGYLGDWRPPAAVLFERQSLSWDTPPRREAGERVAGTVKGGSGERGYPDPSDGNGGGLVETAATLGGGSGSRGWAPDTDRMTFVVASESGQGYWRKGAGMVTAHNRKDPAQAGVVYPDVVPFDTTQMSSDKNYSSPKPGDAMHPLASGAHPPAVAFTQNTRDEVRLQGGDGQIAGAISAQPGAKQQDYIASIQDGREFKDKGQNGRGWSEDEQSYTVDSTGAQSVAQPTSVRRLTPVECERLQGFPDNYTLVPYNGKPLADGPRYKLLGNSMAVPVVRWIGERIKMVQEVLDV